MKSAKRRIEEQALDELEAETPNWLANTIEWLRRPQVKWVRIPLGLFLVVCSFFWFLPIIGIELLPIGLLLLAIDVPFLRKPVGRMVLWLVRKYRSLRARFRKMLP